MLYGEVFRFKTFHLSHFTVSVVLCVLYERRLRKAVQGSTFLNSLTVFAD
jgi:hypothetical protein